MDRLVLFSYFAWFVADCPIEWMERNTPVRFFTPDTLARAGIAKLDPRAYLAKYDSYSFFARDRRPYSGQPDRNQREINVNDIRIVLITRGGQQAE